MILGLIVLVSVMRVSGGMQGLGAGGAEVVLIRVDGMIVAGQSGFSLMGGTATGSDDVVDEIERATADDEVRAILLRVNSPGGSAAGSQEIYNAIQRARSEDMIVVASMADIAASGGYYVAAPTDRIYADPATVTGSIGAIAMHQDMSGLFEKLGMQHEVVKSGELKDMFSPMGPLTEEAREIMRALVEEVHEQFMQAVAEGRGMDMERVRELADGRIYTGAQAAENGLVDELGGMQEALRGAGELAGIEGIPEVKQYGTPSLLRMLLGAGGSAGASRVPLTGGLLYDDFAAGLVRGGIEPELPASPGEM